MTDVETTAAAAAFPQTAATSAPSWTAAAVIRAPFDLIRVLDVAVALAALIYFAPALLLMAVLIRIDGGPAIFSQLRIGYGGRPFKCYKLRSMVMNAQTRLDDLLATNASARAEWERDHKLKNDPRITRIGRFLRKTSLDELPQLINVLKGDMSLVGPRPIVDAEIVRYGRFFNHYCQVRPGITGMWQINGRNDVSYQNRVALDMLYVRRRSLSMYVEILVKTIPCVLYRRGSY